MRPAHQDTSSRPSPRRHPPGTGVIMCAMTDFLTGSAVSGIAGLAGDPRRARARECYGIHTVLE